MHCHATIACITTYSLDGGTCLCACDNCVFISAEVAASITAREARLVPAPTLFTKTGGVKSGLLVGDDISSFDSHLSHTEIKAVRLIIASGMFNEFLKKGSS
jgi:hypothetical protein